MTQVRPFSAELTLQSVFQPGEEKFTGLRVIVEYSQAVVRRITKNEHVARVGGLIKQECGKIEITQLGPRR